MDDLMTLWTNGCLLIQGNPGSSLLVPYFFLLGPDYKCRGYICICMCAHVYQKQTGPQKRGERHKKHGSTKRVFLWVESSLWK